MVKPDDQSGADELREREVRALKTICDFCILRGIPSDYASIVMVGAGMGVGHMMDFQEVNSKTTDPKGKWTNWYLTHILNRLSETESGVLAPAGMRPANAELSDYGTFKRIEDRSRLYLDVAHHLMMEMKEPIYVTGFRLVSFGMQLAFEKRSDGGPEYRSLIRVCVQHAIDIATNYDNLAASYAGHRFDNFLGYQ